MQEDWLGPYLAMKKGSTLSLSIKQATTLLLVRPITLWWSGNRILTKITRTYSMNKRTKSPTTKTIKCINPTKNPSQCKRPKNQQTNQQKALINKFLPKKLLWKTKKKRYLIIYWLYSKLLTCLLFRWKKLWTSSNIWPNKSSLWIKKWAKMRTKSKVCSNTDESNSCNKKGTEKRSKSPISSKLLTNKLFNLSR